MNKLLIAAVAIALSTGAASAATKDGWFGPKGHGLILNLLNLEKAERLEHLKSLLQQKRCDGACVPTYRPSEPSEVPLPAAGFLLLGGLGGLAVVRRKRKAG